ncbi:putative phosphoribosyl-ATP diphosphatase [Erwinia phage vB_EamM_Phobos]|uniref:mazG nucleotide pyrophosphohydrolase n=1 Tax=Erwinia phage vB_EamM_Phobos TaxID=1883377 RepID=UPI00081C5311|nr:mazG nucleotide pyrophosphohydrolase [Erwinia phage vB_EamM_Phobos]ANZ50308.1 putative phosphoribosyl-ATP diphosphatase [Erwinia phage vB_EamM_Phobos]
MKTNCIPKTFTNFKMEKTMTVEAIKVFQVPVKHKVIKFATTDDKLVHVVNKWSQRMFEGLSGPGVQLESIQEISLTGKTLRVVGTERINGEVWFWMPASAIDCGYEVIGEKEYPRDVPLFSIRECVENVLAWSSARGILDNGVWYTQGTKLYEEDGEAATGVGKNKHPLIMDGIGDAIVVLVNLMELTGYEAMEIACHVHAAQNEEAPAGNSHYLFHKMRFHITNAIDYLWDEAGIDSPKKLDFKSIENSVCTCIEYHYEQMLSYANALANAYDMTLEQCFSLAWDEIKDRKGYLNADGIFIKESDA